MRKRSIARIVISSLAGFVFFLILLAIANMLIPNFNNATYSAIVGFLNINLGYLVLLTFVGLINEIFWNLPLFFNLIAPIISAVFSYYLLVFFSRFWDFLKEYLDLNVAIPFNVLYIFIPLIVLFAGYIIIIARVSGFEERGKRRLERDIKDINRAINRIKWEEIGDEFKEALHNLGKSINNLFEEKEKKDRGMKRKK
jgi:hypothetical protein